MKINGAKLVGFPLKPWLKLMSGVSVLLLLAALSISTSAALGVMLGGCIAIATNAFFIWFAYRHRGARQAQLIVNSIYLGETAKFLITAVSLVVVFQVVDKTTAKFALGGLIALSVTSWLISVRLLSKSNHS